MNKLRKKPYSSILEVIVYQIKSGRRGVGDEKLKFHRHKHLTLPSLSNIKTLHNKLNKKGINVDFLSLVKLYCGCYAKKYLARNKESGTIGKHNDIKRDENGEPTIEFDERFYYSQTEPQSYTQKEYSTLTEKENVLKSYILGVDNSLQASGKNEVIAVDLDAREYFSNKNSEEVTDGLQRSSPKRVLNSERSTSHSPKHGNCLDCLKTNYKIQNVDKNESDIFSKQSLNQFSNADSHNPNDDCRAVGIMPHNTDSTLNDAGSIYSSETNTNGSLKLLEKTATLKVENEKVKNYCEVSNENTIERPQGVYLLKEVISGNNIGVSKEWLGEGFIFDKTPTSYGLIQKKVESSGLLATVNAYIIKELLFNDIKNDIENLQPHESQLEPVLIEAMVQILWQAGENKAILAVLANEVVKIKTIEEIIDHLIHQSFISKDDLRNSLKDNIAQFVKKGSHGCILFLISVILSRGVEKVREDMNGTTALINSNGKCTLELINLLLSGTAVSNVFDNHIKLKSNIIKGIPKRSEIGYLSIREHFKYCKVGSYLKTPRFPIWLVHNENHFAIIFSCQKKLLSDWKVERKFIMTYYDAFMHLGKERRMSIDTTLTVDINEERDNTKTTVENCVRTKWKDAYIAWK